MLFQSDKKSMNGRKLERDLIHTKEIHKETMSVNQNESGFFLKTKAI